MSEAHYEQRHGSYYFMRDGNVAFMTDRVCIAYDADTGALLKHGRPHFIIDWFRQVTDVPYAYPVLVVLPHDYDVVEINKCLTISGYAPNLVRRPQIDCNAYRPALPKKQT